MEARQSARGTESSRRSRWTMDRITLASRPMKSRSANLWLLISAQIACMAVGLGVHFLYITATLRHEAEQQARAELATAVLPLVHSLQAIKPDGDSPDPSSEVRALLEAHRPPVGFAWTVVDARWRSLAHVRGDLAEPESLPQLLADRWMDPLVPPETNIQYYESVVKHLGRQRTDGFFRTFMVPGMDHCGGGAGANLFGQAGRGDAPIVDAEHDMLTALMRWVEEGVAPDSKTAKTKE
jgi:hypothetical protein